MQVKQLKKLKNRKISKKRAKAIKLLTELNEIEKEHLKFILEHEKTQKRNKSEGDKPTTSSFWKLNRSYEEKEDKAYKKYYNFLNSQFDLNQIESNIQKFKNGFTDQNFIDFMYNKKFNK